MADDLAPSGYPRGWWGGKRDGQTGRPKQFTKTQKVVRLEPSWADFAKVAQKRVDGPVEESLAIALFEAIDDWLLERYG